jgi:tetratricopeptide (TPR) repeat protein
VTRFLIAALTLFAIPLGAQDVYVPPVPIGIAGEGQVRKPEGPIPFPSAQGRWIRLRSARFDVISSANDIRTRDIAADLDTLASALMRANPRFAPAAMPATVFVFDKRRESQPYFDLLFARLGARATGAYIRHGGGGTMFVDASSRGRFERTAMHELIHDLLRQQDVTPPLWLEEGLAEYFSNSEVRKGSVRAGVPIREHQALLRQKPPMPLAQLFALTSDSPAGASSAFYAQSWAAVAYLMVSGADKFFTFLRDVESGTPLADALRTHYKQSVDDMEHAMRRSAPTRLTVLEGATAVAQEATPLDRATLLFELGSFLSHVPGAEAESQRHYREALTVNPEHARTLAALGEYDRAIAAAPNDPEVHLLYAESLLSTAIGPFAGTFTPIEGDTVKFRKARTLAEHALTIGGNEARTRGILGTTHLVETDLAPGIAQLERALAAAPNRIDFALNLYAMYLRTGARDKADALFASAFENARDKQTIFAARNVYVTVETERANALAQSGKLEEAAAVVQDLAAKTPDAMSRRELETQARNLLAIAATNRDIQTYNRAVELANKGKNREAIAILDDLLTTAKDPNVISDATKLRTDLRKRR